MASVQSADSSSRVTVGRRRLHSRMRKLHQTSYPSRVQVQNLEMNSPEEESSSVSLFYDIITKFDTQEMIKVQRNVMTTTREFMKTKLNIIKLSLSLSSGNTRKSSFIFFAYSGIFGPLLHFICVMYILCLSMY